MNSIPGMGDGGWGMGETPSCHVGLSGSGGEITVRPDPPGLTVQHHRKAPGSWLCPRLERPGVCGAGGRHEDPHSATYRGTAGLEQRRDWLWGLRCSWGTGGGVPHSRLPVQLQATLVASLRPSLIQPGPDT